MGGRDGGLSTYVEVLDFDLVMFGEVEVFLRNADAFCRPGLLAVSVRWVVAKS